MNLKEQHYVLALADYGSITKAAAHLGVSQPALSTYIANLESALRLRLFDRAGKRLIPTYLGEMYILKARQIVALGQEFDVLASHVTGGFTGRLRVGLQIRRSPFLIPSLLKAFRNYYPSVEVILHEYNIQTLEALLLQEKLDLLLCNKTVEKTDMAYEQIYDDQLLFVVAGDHPLCRAAQHRPGSAYPWMDVRLFADEQFILQHEGQSIRYFTNRVLAEQGVQPGRVFLIRNIETASQMAAEGMGVAFNMESYLCNMSYRHAPAYFAIGERQEPIRFAVAHRRNTALPDYAVKFIEILREVMQMQAPSGAQALKYTKF